MDDIKTKIVKLLVDTEKQEWDDIIELQLMKGTEDLPYEPYAEPVTTNIYLDEPLRKLGNYADYINFKENKVVRNIKEFVLKGGEVDYVGHNTIGNYLMFYTTDNNKDVNSVYFTQYILRILHLISDRWENQKIKILSRTS